MDDSVNELVCKTNAIYSRQKIISSNKGALPSMGVTSGSELILPKSVLFLYFYSSLASNCLKSLCILPFQYC